MVIDNPAAKVRQRQVSSGEVALRVRMVIAKMRLSRVKNPSGSGSRLHQEEYAVYLRRVDDFIADEWFSRTK